MNQKQRVNMVDRCKLLLGVLVLLVALPGLAVGSLGGAPSGVDADARATYSALQQPLLRLALRSGGNAEELRRRQRQRQRAERLRREAEIRRRQEAARLAPAAPAAPASPHPGSDNRTPPASDHEDEFDAVPATTGCLAGFRSCFRRGQTEREPVIGPPTAAPPAPSTLHNLTLPEDSPRVFRPEVTEDGVVLTSRSLLLDQELRSEALEKYGDKYWNDGSYMSSLGLTHDDLKTWGSKKARILDVASGGAVFAEEAYYAFGVEVDSVDLNASSYATRFNATDARLAKQLEVEESKRSTKTRKLMGKVYQRNMERLKYIDKENGEQVIPSEARAMFDKLYDKRGEIADNLHKDPEKGGRSRTTADARALTNIRDNAYNVYLNSWLMNYLSPRERISAIKEAVRVVAPGGEIRIQGGDLHAPGSYGREGTTVTHNEAEGSEHSGGPASGPTAFKRWFKQAERTSGKPPPSRGWFKWFKQAEKKGGIYSFGDKRVQIDLNRSTNTLLVLHVLPTQEDQAGPTEKTTEIEKHANRISTLMKDNAFESSLYHGTQSAMLAGLIKTHGRIVPASVLKEKKITPNTGEGPAYSREAEAKNFISIGEGLEGLARGLAYADAGAKLEHYNVRLHKDKELKEKIQILKKIDQAWDLIKIAFGEEGFPELKAYSDRQTIIYELEKLKAETNAANGWPDYPILYEFIRDDGWRIEKRKDASGEALLKDGAIDLNKHVKRVYVPYDNIEEFKKSIRKLHKDNAIEVLALEALLTPPSEDRPDPRYGDLKRSYSDAFSQLERNKVKQDIVVSRLYKTSVALMEAIFDTERNISTTLTIETLADKIKTLDRIIHLYDTRQSDPDKEPDYWNKDNIDKVRKYRKSLQHELDFKVAILLESTEFSRVGSRVGSRIVASSNANSLPIPWGSACSPRYHSKPRRSKGPPIGFVS